MVVLYQQEWKAEESKRKAETQTRAKEIWKKAKIVTNDHAYLINKGINAYGAKVFNESLLIPLLDIDGMIHSLQFIDVEGSKRFLARGTGFLARFLVSWPESTQGFRPFTEAPENWPSLDQFNQRIMAILNQPIPLDDTGLLILPMLTLTVDAKAAWVAFHDEIERELANGGPLHEVRDVASKSADNAARLAVLFQIFEYGMRGAVGLEAFNSASKVVRWHLHESKRFFGELALPVELANAVRLDKWLIDYCCRHQTCLIAKNYTRQHGPLRNGDALEIAIRELINLDRLRLKKEGKRSILTINPELVVLKT